MRASSVLFVGYLSFVFFISAFFMLDLSPFLKVPSDSALTHFLRLVSDADSTISASAAWLNKWGWVWCAATDSSKSLSTSSIWSFSEATLLGSCSNDDVLGFIVVLDLGVASLVSSVGSLGSRVSPWISSSVSGKSADVGLIASAGSDGSSAGLGVASVVTSVSSSGLSVSSAVSNEAGWLASGSAGASWLASVCRSLSEGFMRSVHDVSSLTHTLIRDTEVSSGSIVSIVLFFMATSAACAHPSLAQWLLGMMHTLAERPWRTSLVGMLESLYLRIRFKLLMLEGSEKLTRFSVGGEFISWNEISYWSLSRSE